MKSIPLIFLLLAAPINNAAWQASVESTDLTIESGSIQGSLIATRLQFTTAPDSWGETTLSGSSVLVRSWGRDANITVGVPIYRTEPYETNTNHENFTLVLSEARSRAQLSLYAAEGVAHLTHEGNSSALQTSQKAIFSDNSSASGDLNNPNNEAIQISNTTQYSSRSNWGTVTIEGNFTIRLVEVDFDITDSTGDHQYKSGYEETPAVSGQPDLPAGHIGRTSYREIHLYVKDGHMVFPTLADGEIEYFIHNWTADAPNGIELQNTGGSILGKTRNQELDNNTVYLPGPVTLSNGTSQDNRLFYDAFTPSDTVYVDGQPFTNPPDFIEPPIEEPTDPEPDGATVQKWGSDWWITGGFALFLLVAGLVGIRFQKPFWYVRWQMRRGNHGFVVENAPRFFSKTNQRKKSVILHALALLAVGKFPEATEFIFSLLPQDRPDQPTWNYLAAMGLAGTGEFTEAKQHLKNCLRAAPQYLTEVEQNPLLLRLLADHRDEGSEFT